MRLSGGRRARRAQGGDRRAAEKDVLPLCDACIEEMRALARCCWRALWMNSLRPFGFEVIDIRLSAQIGRLETAGNASARSRRGG